MLKESFQLNMNTMIKEAKERGVRPDDLFSSYNLLVDPVEFFNEITAGTQKDYKEFPFLRIEKNSTYNEFYKVLLAYLDSEGTGDYNYKKLPPAEIRKDNRGEWHPSDGRHRAALCMLLGIKLPVKRVFDMKESLLTEEDHTQQAIDIFGTTYYKTRAGYMLKDGKLLDLTYGGNPREDHRAIQDAFDDVDLDSGSDYLIAFMNEGNIRCIPEIPAVDISIEPTDRQYAALKDYISYWIGHDRHFEVQFSDKNGNQVDWKEYNGFVSAQEVILDIKDYFSGNLNESLEYDYKVSDLIGTKTLYHATYKPYWEEIKREGKLKPKAHDNWDISENYIYLSRDYGNAYSYCEEAENVPEEWLDQIVVLEIDADKLNIDLLDIDHNQAYGNYDEVDVEDPQTWIEFQYEGNIPISYVRKVHDESAKESLNEVYPQKGESKSDFINRFMRATAKEYPNVKQRYAVAYSYWDRRKLKEAIKDVENPKDKSFQDQINEMKGDLDIILYTALNGHNYGEEFLDDLYINQPKLCGKMLANIQILKLMQANTPIKYSKYLRDGIYEIRASIATNEARELYFFPLGKQIIITNGFLKKSQKTPKNEIEKARKLMDEYHHRDR